jgi:hypothetical protein
VGGLVGLTHLASQPFVAIVSILALAMGTGFTTTMFRIVRGATRSLPFAESHESWLFRRSPRLGT